MIPRLKKNRLEMSGDLRKYSTTSIISDAQNTDKVCTIDWSDGLKTLFDEDWLRDNCQCPLCVHQSTHERLHHYAELENPGVEELTWNPIGLNIIWNDGHHSYYDSGWLRSHSIELVHKDVAKTRLIPWEAKSFTFRSFSLHELEVAEKQYEAIGHLLEHGAMVVKDVSAEEQEVVRFTETIGSVRSTNFGTVFDIQKKQDPNSNADTEMEFLPHTDIAHHSHPPGFQLLHFIVNSAAGGASTLTDGYRIFLHLQKTNPELLEVLSRPAYIFRYQDDQCDHSYRGPIFELDHDRKFKSIRFDPIGIEPMIGTTTDVREQRIAVKELMTLLVDPKFRVKRKFNAGEILVFENTRLLHGRTAYSPGAGERKLQGCYIDLGNVTSKYQVLARELGSLNGYVYDDAGKLLTATVT